MSQKQDKMKHNRFYTIIYLISVLLASTSCTQDELMEQGDNLPEGRYPLLISSVTLDAESNVLTTPKTRVSENPDGNSSVWDWDGTEKIGVQIDGDDEAGTFTLNNDRTLTADNMLYWKNTQTTTVTAWYPVETEVSLANQSDKLAYVLKGSGEGNFDNPVALNFSHALAKVRVVFSDRITPELTPSMVSILAPTTCTVNKGVVTPGRHTDYIPMHRAWDNDGNIGYEANVTPNLTLKDNAFQLFVDGKRVNCSTTEVITQAGQLHVIELTLNEKVTEVNVADITDKEYTVSGNVHLKGDGNAKDLKLIMKPEAKLTIENVNLAPTTDGNAITCKAKATITLKGSNTLTGKYTSGFGYCGIQVEGGLLTINGANGAKLITNGAGSNSAGIGATNGASIIINGGYIVANHGVIGESTGIGSAGWGRTCGNIIINDGIIESWGGSYSAGIGGSNSGDCGDIIIRGGNIKAYGGLQSPGIGNGDDASCGNITILGASTVVYAKKGTIDLQKPAEPIGWNNYNGSCGTVTIGSECDVTQE